MDAIEAIMTRRSIRKYADKPIDDNLVRQLLQAAMAAPSAGNEQPWHFVVIWDRAVLDRIPDFHPYAQMLKGAALAILVCADADLETLPGRMIMDCSAATENMLLAAHALGLGAVWVGIYPVEERITELRKLLEIPSRVVPVALVSLGFPSERYHKENRYKPERIHLEKWPSSENKEKDVKKEK